MDIEYSLVMGRFQPFHDGHKKLIQTLIDEGKMVCVAIKDTGLDENNPYTIDERRIMIRKAFEYREVHIITVPNISEVCYGRRVGWGMREIKHDKEHISGTEIRRDNKKNG